ncbi:MAG: hypothetical protein IKE38_03820 [Erysipelotrichaceae bacterium]|nr:hypothetical protein [Erysipelotrichaceae bacterium]
MDKKVAFFHTTMGTPLPLKKAFEERYPGVPLITVMDDSVLPEVNANGGLYTRGIVRRLVNFATNAQLQGACVCCCMCTTLTGAVAEAQKACEIPFITIDGPMLAEAVTKGDRLALVVTAKTTITASGNSARQAAIAAGKPDMKIDVIYAEGAFEAKNQLHDDQLHDKIVVDCCRKAALDHDVIALAQVSMVNCAESLTDLGIPVLTSLDSGLAQLEKYIG